MNRMFFRSLFFTSDSNVSEEIKHVSFPQLWSVWTGGPRRCVIGAIFRRGKPKPQAGLKLWGVSGVEAPTDGTSPPADTLAVGS